MIQGNGYWTVHDTRVVKIRKILLMEQFRGEQARALASRHFLTGIESMFTTVFSGMIENGSIKDCDPTLLAITYTAPITSMVHLCDREPEKETEAIERIKACIGFFVNTFGIRTC